jgi:hypothetical protein
MDLSHKVKKQIIKATDSLHGKLSSIFKSSTFIQKKNPPTVLSIAIYSMIQVQVGSYASAGDPTWDSFHPYQRGNRCWNPALTLIPTSFFFFGFFNRKEGQ